jgi:hypothetical protein
MNLGAVRYLASALAYRFALKIVRAEARTPQTAVLQRFWQEQVDFEKQLQSCFSLLLYSASLYSFFSFCSCT